MGLVNHGYMVHARPALPLVTSNRGECHVTQDAVDGYMARGRVRMDRRREGRGTRYSRVAAGPGGESEIRDR